MIAERACARCGAIVDPFSPGGSCGRCLFLSAIAPSASDLPGPACSFGDYELLEEIGRGGMGVVYRARQAGLNRIVALKMLMTGPFAGAGEVNRFRNEAHAIAALKHPCIVAIHEIGSVDDLHFYSMDFIAGENLDQKLKAGPWPCDRAVDCLRTIAEAIQFAHAHGVLHRDLKPSNILIDSSGLPHITDFGLAKRLDADSDLTLTGQVFGSPNFMPPEQAQANASALGPWSDVYSLGAILFHLLTGRPPFQAQTIPETFQALLHSEPVSPRLLNSSVSGDLDTICLKCLEKDRTRRYQSAGEVALELARIQRGEPIQARPVGRVSKLWRWCARKPALAAAIGVAMILFLILAVASPLVAFEISRQRQEAELQLYAANIHVAQQNLFDHQLAPARTLLADIAGSGLQRPIRGWEWRYLAGQTAADSSVCLEGHQSWVAGVRFSPSNEILVSISYDGEARAWDWRNKRLVRAWSAHFPSDTRSHLQNHALAFTPDGVLLATGGADGFVRLWSFPEAGLLMAFSLPDSSVTSLSFSADGMRLAATTISGVTVLWERTNGSWTERQVIKVNFQSEHAAFSPDGNFLFVISNHTMRRWSIPDTGDLIEWPAFPETTSLAVAPEGVLLAASTRSENAIRIWELPGFQELPNLSARTMGANTLAISTGARWLASADPDNNISLYDLQKRAVANVFRGHTGAVVSLAFSSDGDVLASAAEESVIRLWKTSPASPDRGFETKFRKIYDLKFLADSQRFLVAGDLRFPDDRISSGLALWHMNGNQPLAFATNEGYPVHQQISLSSDGNHASCNDSDIEPRVFPSRAKVFSLPSLAVEMELTNSHSIQPGMRPLVYASGRRLLSRASLDAPPKLLGSVGSNLRKVLLAPDRRTIVTSEEANPAVVKIWSVSGSHASEISAHHGPIAQLAFSLDGAWLASASWDGTAVLYDVRARQWMGTLRGHQAQVNTVAFSPDGETLASGSSDGTVRVWHRRTLRELCVLKPGVGAVWAVTFSPDGRWLLAGGTNGKIQKWRAPSFHELETAGLP